MIDNIFNILNLKQTSIVLNFLMDEMTILFVSFVVSSLLALLLHKCARLTKVINWLFKLILVVPIFLLIEKPKRGWERPLFLINTVKSLLKKA